MRRVFKVRCRRGESDCGLQDVRLRVGEVPVGGEGRQVEGRPGLVPPGRGEPDHAVLAALALQHVHLPGYQALHEQGRDGRVHEPVAGEAAGVHEATDVPVPADDGRAVRGGPVEPARHGDALVLRGHQAGGELPHLVHHEVAVGRAAVAVVGAEPRLEQVLELRAEVRLGIRVVPPAHHEGARVGTAVRHPTGAHPVDGHGQATPEVLVRAGGLLREGQVPLDRSDGQRHATQGPAQARRPGVRAVDHRVTLDQAAVREEDTLDLAADDLGAHDLGLLHHGDPHLARPAEAELVDEVVLEEAVRVAPGTVADPPHLVSVEVRPAPHDLVHVQELDRQAHVLLHLDLGQDLLPRLFGHPTALVVPALDALERLPQEQVAVRDEDVLALGVRGVQVLVDVRVPALAVHHPQHRLRLAELRADARRRAAAAPVPDLALLQGRDLVAGLGQLDRAERAGGTATDDDDVATRRQRVCFRHSTSTRLFKPFLMFSDSDGLLTQPFKRV